MHFKLLFLTLAFSQWVSAVLLGVDFGEEFSKAILVAPNVQFDILLTPESKRKGLSGISVVPNASFDKMDRKYGSDALPQCSKNPKYCFFGVKSVLNGADMSSIDRYSEIYPGTDLAAVDSTPVLALSREKGKQSYLYPEEIIGMQLREIKQRALDHWKESSPETFEKDGEITELVISVPRYFNEFQRKALRDSASLAGMEIVSLVDDGLAIGIDFAQKSEIGEELEQYLVLDVGASASKATLVGLKNVNDTITLESLGYGFDTTISGKLFTHTIRETIIKKFAKEHKLNVDDLLQDDKLLRRVWLVAEKTKLVLSANGESRVSIESFYNDIDLKQDITREEIESILKSQVKSKLTSVLDSALGSINKKDIKGVILAGGSFRVPLIQSTLTNYFGGDDLFLKSVNADESVVFGTTLKGAAIKGLMRRKNLNIIDHDFNSHVIKYSETPVENGLSSYPVFETVEQGAIANQQQLVNLTNSKNKYIKEFQVEVFTNGENTIKSHYYNFTMPRRFDESTCDDYQYFMNYHYDADDLFSVNYLKVKCTKNGGVKTGNLLKQSNILGLSAASRISLNEKLNKLDEMDEELRNKTALINKLESLSYETRYLLEDSEEFIEVNHFELLNTAVGTALEWIEEESETSGVEEITERIEIMEHAIKVINAHVSLKDWDTAMETLENILTSIQESLDDTLRLMERVDSSEKKLMMEINERGLDYNEMTSKVAQSSKPGYDLIHNTRDYINELKEILELVESVDSEGYRYLMKDGWIDTIISSHVTVSKLDKYKKYYKSSWDHRNGFVQHQLTELRNAEEKEKRKLKRAQKKREIEEAIEIEKATPKVEEEVVVNVEENSTQTPPPPPIEDVQSHDEL